MTRSVAVKIDPRYFVYILRNSFTHMTSKRKIYTFLYIFKLLNIDTTYKSNLFFFFKINHQCVL